MNAAICGNKAKPILFLVAQKLIVSRAERKVYPAYPSASSENESLTCHSGKGSGINKGGGGDDQGGCSMRGAAVALLFRSARSARGAGKGGTAVEGGHPGQQGHGDPSADARGARRERSQGNAVHQCRGREGQAI